MMLKEQMISKRKWSYLFFFLNLLFFFAQNLYSNEGRVTQISTINLLLAGCYDGVETIGELLQNGDFGIGTVDRIDGELVVLDSVPYKISADGSVEVLSPSVTVPFASVSFFHREDAVCVPIEKPISRTELLQQIESHFSGPCKMGAVMLEGSFHQ